MRQNVILDDRTEMGDNLGWGGNPTAGKNVARLKKMMCPKIKLLSKIMN